MVRVAAGMLAALLACGGELFLPGGDGAVLVSAAEKVTGDDIDQLRSKLSGLSAKARRVYVAAAGGKERSGAQGRADEGLRIPDHNL